MNKFVEFLSKDYIKYNCSLLALQIRRDYIDKNPLLLGTLKGSLFFTTEICKNLAGMTYDLYFCNTKSYTNTNSSGFVKIESIPNCEGRHVILLDEIVDTGTTLHYLLKIINDYSPKSVEICTLINNLYRRKEELYVKYSGITLEKPWFFVGFGMDENDKYREYPNILRREI